MLPKEIKKSGDIILNKPEKARLCHEDADRFIVSRKTNDIYKDIAEAIKTRFDTSSYELDRLFYKENSKK